MKSQMGYLDVVGTYLWKVCESMISPNLHFQSRVSAEIIPYVKLLNIIRMRGLFEYTSYIQIIQWVTM